LKTGQNVNISNFTQRLTQSVQQSVKHSGRLRN